MGGVLQVRAAGGRVMPGQEGRRAGDVSGDRPRPQQTRAVVASRAQHQQADPVEQVGRLHLGQECARHCRDRQPDEDRTILVESDPQACDGGKHAQAEHRVAVRQPAAIEQRVAGEIDHGRQGGETPVVRQLCGQPGQYQTGQHGRDGGYQASGGKHMIPAEQVRNRYDQPVVQRRTTVGCAVQGGDEEITAHPHLQRADGVDPFLADVGQPQGGEKAGGRKGIQQPQPGRKILSNREAHDEDESSVGTK